MTETISDSGEYEVIEPSYPDPKIIAPEDEVTDDGQYSKLPPALPPQLTG